MDSSSSFLDNANIERRVMDPDKRAFVRVAGEDAATLAARRLASTSIQSFTGPYEFLSTLSRSRVVLPGDGVLLDGSGDGGDSDASFFTYPTVEHALQAAKSQDVDYREGIRACKDPLEAKRKGAKAPGLDKEEWKNKHSLEVMEALLRDKFRRHKGLRAQLLATGTQSLIYENEHNDQFWGVCKGKGTNHLGRLLERVRADEKEGLLAVLLWAKQVFQAMPDSRVCVDMKVTREGAPLPEADQTLEKKAIITFGKLAENDVNIAHPSSSRLHALLVISSVHGPVLVDLEAANGTFVEERRISPFKGVKLVSGRTVVGFGTSTRRYVFSVDMAYDAKKGLALYEVLEDPLKLAAERPDLGVFVNNLPKEVNEEMLHEFFGDCGTVLQVVLPKHKTTGEVKGFAIVLFGTEAAVVAALKLDRDEMKGVEVRVKRQKPKVKEEGGGGKEEGGGGEKGRGGGGRGERREERGGRGGGRGDGGGERGHYSPGIPSSSCQEPPRREEEKPRARSRSSLREREAERDRERRDKSRSRGRDRDRDRDRERERERRCSRSRSFERERHRPHAREDERERERDGGRRERERDRRSRSRSRGRERDRDWRRYRSRSP